MASVYGLAPATPTFGAVEGELDQAAAVGGCHGFEPLQRGERVLHAAVMHGAAHAGAEDDAPIPARVWQRSSCAVRGRGRSRPWSAVPSPGNCLSGRPTSCAMLLPPAHPGHSGGLVLLPPETLRRPSQNRARARRSKPIAAAIVVVCTRVTAFFMARAYSARALSSFSISA